MTVAAYSPATSSVIPHSNVPYSGGARDASAVVFHRGREGGDPGPPRAHRADIFSGLGEDEMRRVTACARSLRKARGEFIYMLGESADFVYVLRQGRVKLSVLAETGKETAIDIIEPGEIFGEFALVDESARSNMTQALDDVTMWAFNKRDFARLLAESKLAMNYIRMVGDRRRRM
jgi:CRP-like cAMP-binding protein